MPPLAPKWATRFLLVIAAIPTKEITRIKFLTITKKTVTEPTCTEIGFTTSVCEVCGDTVKSDYKNAKGHAPSEWIIDEAATIEHGGKKHIECTWSVKKNFAKHRYFPNLWQRIIRTRTAKAEIGGYSVILTDKNNKPVFNSEITIDKDDNIFNPLAEKQTS